ncbi:MAG: TonB-dependent receptor [Bacteroidota bacterium]
MSNKQQKELEVLTSMKKNLLILVLALFTVELALAQTTGYVYHANDSTPLRGVHVVTNGEVVAITDKQGYFQVEDVNSQTIIFRHVGFQNDTLTVENNSGIRVFLHSISEELPGVSITSWSYFNDYRHQLSHVSTLRPEQISESSVVNPVETLHRKSGIEFQRGARNTQKITIRGAGARSMYSTTRINVFFNGVPLSSAMGEVFLDDLLWNDMSDVSIIKGAVPPVFGSAAGGVILLNKNQTGNKSKFSSGFSSGSAGSLHHYYNAQIQTNRISADVQYQNLSEDGFRENSSYRGESVNSFITFRLNENHRLQSFTLFSDMKGYIPSSLSKNNFQNNPFAAGGSWGETGGYEKNMNVVQGITLHSAYQGKLSQETTIYGLYRDGNERRPFNTLADKHSRAGLRTVLTAELGGGMPGQWLWQAGGMYQYGDYRWKTLETLENNQTGEVFTDQKQLRQEAGVFLFSSYKLANWKAEAGIHVNRTHYITENALQQEKDQEYEPGSIFSPYFSLAYQPVDFMLLYLTSGRGSAAPAYEEAIDSEGEINTALKPEKSWKHGMGAQFRNDRFMMKAEAFLHRVSDQLITRRLAEDRFTKVNAGKSQFRGIEAESNVVLLQNRNIELALHAAYTFSDYTFLDFKEEGADYSGNQIPGIPRHRAFAGFDLKLAEHFILKYSWLFSGKFPLNDENDIFYGGHNRMNMELNYQRKIADQWSVDGFLRFGNITGEEYAAMVVVNAVGFGGASPRFYYPGQPENIHAGLRINYIFNIL